MATLKSNIWWIGLIILGIGLAIEWWAFASPEEDIDAPKRKNYIYGGAATAVIGAVLLFWGLKQK